MCHRHFSIFAILLAALFSLAADKAKEPTPSAAQIQLWVKQLGNDSFKVREEAMRNLIKAGGAAYEAVIKATKSEDVEVHLRALMIIKDIEKQLVNAAIAYFKKLGGSVTVDDNSPGKPVIKLSLYGTEVTDAGLVNLRWLSSLQILHLDDTKITEAGLVHLKGLTKLKLLFLEAPNVTKAGIEKLEKALPNCRIVPLVRTPPRPVR